MRGFAGASRTAPNQGVGRAGAVSVHSPMADGLTARRSPAVRALALAAAFFSIAFSLVAPPSPRGGATPPSSITAVIVRAEGLQLVAAERAVRLGGGRIGLPLPIIAGFAATVPTARIGALRKLPVIAAITEDGAAEFKSDYDPGTDPFSMLNAATGTGAKQAWAMGATGAGVDVAVIDSGVTPVPGLSEPGKLISGPDFSFESGLRNLAHLDGYGHGTFMAGLIAGRDAGSDLAHPGASYLGVAPNARIVNVKVGAADGSVRLSQIIAGIDWVTAHRRDNGMNIRVLNLSLGINSHSDYLGDPLAQAAQAAWRSGLVVVAAAGNEGRGPQQLATPAIDPYVVAVGALTGATYATLLGNRVADFSNEGDGNRNPDLLAPGAHMQGLRVPGSFIDQRYPSAVVGTRFFRGSGTSESAAIVSGAAALLLQKRPDLRPDDVKALLRQGAQNLTGVSITSQGSGALQLLPSLLAPVPGKLATQTYPVSERDSDEEDNGQSAPSHWSGTTWTGTTWTGTTWTGTTWTGTTWTGTTWTGTTWTGTTWTNALWAGIWGQ